MPTNTYVALDKVTTNGSTSTITFSSIPSTYTDLALVVQGANSNVANARWRINGDTGTNYSWTGLGGTGSAAATTKISNTSTPQLDWYGYFDGTQSNLITHFMNYSNTTTFKTVLSRSNNSNNGVATTIGLWRNTAAINTIAIISSNGNWDTGTTFSLYGIKAQVTPGTAKATGGTITYDNSGNVIHTFTSSGTFTPSQALSVEYLVVAGGGGAGANQGKGAGAGGYRSSVVGELSGGGASAESKVSLLSSQAYTVEVGAGGAGGGDGSSPLCGIKGVNSSISGPGITTITSIGGGGGGSATSAANFATWDAGGKNGGSGGANTGLGTAGQGYNSGSQSGGGAGAAGGNSVTSAGGIGVASAITGTYVYRAGGGTGYENTVGTTGGGGAGSTPGTVNTGGGGGPWNGSGSAGAGGSGIVIVRYSGV